MDPPKKEIFSSREQAVSAVGARGPKNFNHEGDSYNEDLYERISLVRTDSEYLLKYTNRLQVALDTIKSCALEDFRELVAKRIEGKRLLKHACSEFLDPLSDKKSSARCIDPITGLHMLDPKAEHPKLLANLLYVVDREMAGVPKVNIGFSSDGKEQITNSGNPHWRFVCSYGKNNLLPYLGIMNSCSLAIHGWIEDSERAKSGESERLQPAEAQLHLHFSALTTPQQGGFPGCSALKCCSRGEKGDLNETASNQVSSPVDSPGRGSSWAATKDNTDQSVTAKAMPCRCLKTNTSATHSNWPNNIDWLGLRLCARRKSGGRTPHVIEKNLTSNTSEIAEILVLVAEHEIHHSLSSEAGNRPEKAGLAQMDLIALPIVGRAITPTGAKGAELKSIPFNTRATTTNVAQNISNRFGLLHSSYLHR